MTGTSSEFIIEVIERPYLMDGMVVCSYGEQREMIIRCRDCIKKLACIETGRFIPNGFCHLAKEDKQ